MKKMIFLALIIVGCSSQPININYNSNELVFDEIMKVNFNSTEFEIVDGKYDVVFNLTETYPTNKTLDLISNSDVQVNEISFSKLVDISEFNYKYLAKFTIELSNSRYKYTITKNYSHCKIK